MSAIYHKCGILLLVLRKPLHYYAQRYGDVLWGLRRSLLLMEKQHNRGQDGAGLLCLSWNKPPGIPYMNRIRVVKPSPPWKTLIQKVEETWRTFQHKHPNADVTFVENHFPYAGNIYLGHLRYGTFGGNSESHCHPVIRYSQWKSRCIAIAGNFNLTNVEELFQRLLSYGQHPRFRTDTETMVERFGYILDQLNDELLSAIPHVDVVSAYEAVAQRLDLKRLLARVTKPWDGGYAIVGVLGHGDAFALRDPHGIRPCYYYWNEDFVVVASERPAITTALQVPIDAIEALPPAHALIIKRAQQPQVVAYTTPQKQQSCSFERIYFSRGSDPKVYQERKQLGYLLTPQVLQAIDYDIENTIFTYVPNTSISAYLGLLQGLEHYLDQWKQEQIKKHPEKIQTILSKHVRAEHLIYKDTKMRTFITEGDKKRDELVAHVYDTTYGVVRPYQDRLVCIDDSIVRGTTLKQSIIRILSLLKPKQLVIVSSAPQIRYPDCYGIDMSRLDNLIAFQAAIALLRERGMEERIHEVYYRCKEAEAKGTLHEQNFVKAIYEPFSYEEVSQKIAEMLAIPSLECPLTIVYQTLENLKRAIPDHRGDWYFSGNYPTPGGNVTVNRAYILYYEGVKQRAYQI